MKPILAILRRGVLSVVTCILHCASLPAAAPSETLQPPRFETPVFSPGGNRFAALARYENGKRYVLVVDCTTLKPSNTSVLGTNNEGKEEIRNVQSFAWLGDDTLALFFEAQQGTTGLQIAKVGKDVASGHRSPSHYALVGPIPNSPSLLVSVRPAGNAAGLCRVLRLDPASPAGGGEEVFRCESHAFEAHADRDGEVRLIRRDRTPGGEAAWFARAKGVAEWRQLQLPPWTRVLGFDYAQPDLVFVGGHFQSDIPGIHYYSLADDRHVRTLAANRRYALDEIGTLLFCEGLRSLVGLSFDGDLPTTTWVHPAFTRLQTSIDSALPGSRNLIVAWSPDLKRMIVRQVHADRPAVFQLVDNENRKMSFLFANGGRVKPESTALQEMVTILNRDKVKLTGYLTAPRPASAKLPLVILLGPDPWSRRNHYGWDNQAQFLAEAGLAVFRFNPRGSANLLGDASLRWESPGDVQKPLDDLADALDYLVREKAIDPARIAVVGLGGGGGWMAAQAVAALPGRFRCLATLAATFDLEHYRRDEALRQMGSIPFADASRKFTVEQLQLLSPVHQTTKGLSAAFLGYGQWSPAPVIAESDQFARRLAKSGVVVDPAYTGAFWGIGLDNEANLTAYFTELRKFLKKRL